MTKSKQKSRGSHLSYLVDQVCCICRDAQIDPRTPLVHLKPEVFIDMFYIIDGNNLAGRLGLIGQENFDKTVVSLIKDFMRRHPSVEVMVVFDGRDLMGDRAMDGNLTIIYTPRDDQYEGNADRMIAERTIALVIDNKFKAFAPKEIELVTDDSGIREELKDLVADRSIRIIWTNDFAGKLNFGSEADDVKIVDDGKRGLKKDEQDKINQELLNFWKDK